MIPLQHWMIKLMRCWTFQFGFCPHLFPSLQLSNVPLFFFPPFKMKLWNMCILLVCQFDSWCDTLVQFLCVMMQPFGCVYILLMMEFYFNFIVPLNKCPLVLYIYRHAHTHLFPLCSPHSGLCLFIIYVCCYHLLLACLLFLCQCTSQHTSDPSHTCSYASSSLTSCASVRLLPNDDTI